MIGFEHGLYLEAFVQKFVAVAVVAGVLTAGLGFSSVGWSQAKNPTVDELIGALKLGAGASRGSKPVPAAGASTQPSAAAPSAVTPRATVAAVPQAAPASGPGIYNMNILFVTGSAELTPDAETAVGIIGQALKNPVLADNKFRIEGHTDTVGSPDNNRVLSERRAAMVVKVLIEKYGIPASRLEAIGVGQEGLSVPTGDQVPEPRNRRVRLINISG